MSAERHRLFWRTVRFGVVGLSCTAIYVAIALAVLQTGASLTVSHIAGYVVSIICSYVGQKAFTFRVRGRHRRSTWRFAVATGCIALAQYLLVLSLDNAAISSQLVLIASAVFYPIASYLVHSAWTFRETR